MSHHENTVTIQILNKSFDVKCPTDQEQELHHCVHYLNQKMKHIDKHGSKKSFERIAVMAALNISHELLCTDEQKNHLNSEVNDRIKALSEKINNTLSCYD